MCNNLPLYCEIIYQLLVNIYTLWNQGDAFGRQGAGSIVFFFSKLFAPCPMLYAFKPIIPSFQYSNIPIHPPQ